MKGKKLAMLTALIFAMVVFGAGCGATTTEGGGDVLKEPPLPEPVPIEVPAGGGDSGWGTANEGAGTGPDSGAGGGTFVSPAENPDFDGDGIVDTQDPDADGDGVGFADGDCDDLDPLTYPGAPDEPNYPDYTDSNCDGIDGDLGMALWVAPDGDDQNPGTIDAPLRSIHTALMKAQPQNPQLPPMDVYIVEGGYIEMLGAMNGVGIYGGFGGLREDGLRDRDIDLHKVMLKNSTLLVGPATTGFDSVVEGIEVKSAQNSPALVVMDASPVIRHNRFIAAKGVSSIAVHVYGWARGLDMRPVLYDNFIKSDKTEVPEHFEPPANARNSIGIYASSHMEARMLLTLDSNRIQSGNAEYMSCGAMVFSGPAARLDLVAEKNKVDAASGGAYTMGLALGYDLYSERPAAISSAIISKNKIFGGERATGGFGIMVRGVTEELSIVNNFITGGRNTAFGSYGISLSNVTGAKVVSNTVNAGKSRELAVALHLEGTTIDTAATNNIFFADERIGSTGVLEDLQGVEPKELRNNLFSRNLAWKYISFVEGVLSTAAEINSMQDVELVSGNILGSEKVKDVSAMNYHVEETSAALGRGLVLDFLADDIDGDLRAAAEAVDIGADEVTGGSEVEAEEPVDEDQVDDDEGFEDGDGCDEDEDFDGDQPYNGPWIVD